MAALPLLTFCSEEDLLLPVEQGGGYLTPRFAETLKDGRYHILRKLGVGQYSSIWLVHDTEPRAPNLPAEIPSFRAAKVLTVAATKLHLQGIILELEVWHKLKGRSFGQTLPVMYDHFIHEGRDGAHLCLITTLASINLSTYRKTFPDGRIPPWILKPLLGSITSGLSDMHAAGIMHTDVEPTNIVLGTMTDDESIGKYLAETPVEMYGEVQLQDGQRRLAWVSQPLPYDIPQDITPTKAELLNSYLIGFGQAQWIGKPPTEKTLMAFALRAPELVLDIGLGKEVDVWSFGCLIFEMLTGEWLFDPKDSDGISVEDDHLAQMTSLFNEKFPRELLDRSPLRSQFFDDKGDLLRSPSPHMKTIEARLRECPALKVKPDDIEMVTSLIRECVRLDPSQRPTADELGRHPWFWDTYMVGSTYEPHMDLSSSTSESESV